MGWERRQRGPGTGYFYRSVRVGDRVRKMYHGRGPAGHEAAAAVELRRQGRLEAKKLIQDARAGADESDRLAAELRGWADAVLAAWLVLTGHRRRRGQWRASRG